MRKVAKSWETVPNMTFERFLNILIAAKIVKNQSELARMLGLSKQATANAKRKQTVPLHWLDLLGNQGISKEYILTGSGAPFVKGKIKYAGPDEYFTVRRILPQLDESGILVEDKLLPRRHAFQHAWIASKGNPEEMITLEVTGPSLAPVINDRDVVLIDTARKEIEDGRYYAIAINSMILIRMVHIHPDGIRINFQEDAVIVSPEKLNIVGKVIWVCHELA